MGILSRTDSDITTRGTFPFFLQYHRVVYQDTGKGDLSGHESLHGGVFDPVSWILRRLVYGSESLGQTRYVPVRLLFEVISLRKFNIIFAVSPQPRGIELRS